jgi:mRNA-degrading endonuclease toxin of MazEF toxin-antitoxin module
LAFDRDDVVVVFISSVLPKLDFFEIKTTNENGLKINSFIKYTKIASIDRKLVQGSIGNLNEKNFKNLKNKIKIFLNL